MLYYVTGFYFDHNYNDVALIKKTHPPYQAGKLNGAGGKIETGESALKAMRREFKEELGVDVEETRWKRFATLSGISRDSQEFLVHFFMTEGILDYLSSQTDEQLVIIPAKHVAAHNTLPNLTWLIPMALSMKDDDADEFFMHESYTDGRNKRWV